MITRARPWNNRADVDQSQPENQNRCRYSNEMELLFLRFNYVNIKRFISTFTK